MTEYDIAHRAVEHTRGIFPFAGALIVLAITDVSWAYFLGEMPVLKAIAVLTIAAVGTVILTEPFVGLWLFIFLLATEGLFCCRGAFTFVKRVGMVAFASFLVIAALRRTAMHFDTFCIAVIPQGPLAAYTARPRPPVDRFPGTKPRAMVPPGTDAENPV